MRSLDDAGPAAPDMMANRFIGPLKALGHAAGRAYIGRICRGEYSTQVFSHHNERLIEYRFALQAIVEHRPERVLDVGTGTSAWPHLLRNCGCVMTAIDNVRDYWPDGVVNRHWTVLPVDITQPQHFPEQFDAITCLSVLEHIRKQQEAMRNMVALLRPRGILVLTCPYNHRTYAPNVYERQDALYGKGNFYICQSFSRQDLDHWLALGLVLSTRELWRLFSGPVWATGSHVPWQVATEDESHQLGCFVFTKCPVP